VKDFLDRQTIDLPILEKPMLYQVNYKYLHPASKKIRNAATVVDAKDVNEARKLALPEIKAEFDHNEITTIKAFGKQS